MAKNAPGDTNQALVNVSYDPTRELYQTLNPLFIASYEKATGHHLAIVQSHGGSSRQARKIIGGAQQADVVTLGLFTDIDSLRKRGLIAAGWADRLPNHSLPDTSTIVFVVRKDNTRRIADWPDLLAPGVEVVTPDPRTSGNGKLAALVAWAGVWGAADWERFPTPGTALRQRVEAGWGPEAEHGSAALCQPGDRQFVGVSHRIAYWQAP